MKNKALIANGKDNVATALKDIQKGETMVIESVDKAYSIQMQEDIKFGHKFALEDIRTGEDVVKYGEVIGGATCEIKKGVHVHFHNVESKRGRGDLKRREGEINEITRV